MSNDKNTAYIYQSLSEDGESVNLREDDPMSLKIMQNSNITYHDQKLNLKSVIKIINYSKCWRN